jgi:hypothetical protein
MKGSSSLDCSHQIQQIQQIQPHTATVQRHSRPGSILKPFEGAKRTIVILSLALAGCRGQVLPASPTPDVVAIRLLADSSTSPLLQDLSQSYRPPGLLITWDIQVGEVSTVLGWLKSAQAPYALVDYSPAIDSALWATPVGQDGIAIIVHPGNPVANLTAAQLRQIFQGNVANWQSLGGASLPVTIVVQSEGTSAAALIQSMVLGDRRVTRGARLATTSQGVIDIVRADPGAIGYVSMGYLTSSVRAVSLDGIALTPETVSASQYPLRTPILFVGLRAPENDAYRAFVVWAQSPDGQAVVRRRYGRHAVQ